MKTDADTRSAWRSRVEEKGTPEAGSPEACLLACLDDLDELDPDIASDHDVRCAAEAWWRWERQFTVSIPECMKMNQRHIDVLGWVCDGRCPDTTDEENAKPGLRDSRKAAAELAQRDADDRRRGFNNEGDRIGGECVSVVDAGAASKP